MPILERNVKLKTPPRVSPWRKVAIGTWKTAGDPTVYGTLDIQVDKVLSYLQTLREKTDTRITLTHFTGKALAETLKQHPEINCILRFGRIYPRNSIDVFFQVATDSEGKDLSGTVVRNADQKTVLDIAKEMEQTVHNIRTHQDPTYKKMKRMIGRMPSFMSSWMINLSGFFLYSLNLWTPMMGIPKDSFGSAMITNYGTLGKLGMAFAPLVPYSRVPLLLALSSVEEQPVVRNGQIVIAQIMKVCVTFDHRIIDGVHGSKMAKTFMEFFEEPQRLS